MKTLQHPTENMDIEVLPGIVITLSPITSFDMAVIKSEVQKNLDDLERGLQVVGDSGLLISEEYDPANPTHVVAMRRILTVKKIGTRHIRAWTGIKGAEGDADLPPTKENIEAALNNWAFSEVFYEKVTALQYMHLIAKKKSLPAAPGTASAAGEKDTADSAG